MSHIWISLAYQIEDLVSWTFGEHIQTIKIPFIKFKKFLSSIVGCIFLNQSRFKFLWSAFLHICMYDTIKFILFLLMVWIAHQPYISAIYSTFYVTFSWCCWMVFLNFLLRILIPGLGWSSVIEYLPRIWEVLDSIPNSTDIHTQIIWLSCVQAEIWLPQICSRQNPLNLWICCPREQKECFADVVQVKSSEMGRLLWICRVGKANLVNL